MFAVPKDVTVEGYPQLAGYLQRTGLGSLDELVGRALPNLVDPAELARSRDDLRARLMAERATQLIRSILNEKRRDTVVTVNEELLQRFAPTRS